MENETQKFLEAEETAKKLVHTLEQLHTEATSYQAATGELESVRKRLVEFIESTGQIVKDSHRSIKLLTEMGGPEILSRLNRLRTLVMITLGSSIAAIIIGIVTVLR